jgi:hypothetical protein
MTEPEWLKGNDPQRMLAYLLGKDEPGGSGLLGWLGLRKRPTLAGARDAPSLRKLRLFACACVRRVWPLLTDQASKEAVRTSERYADGKATVEELRAARAAALAVPASPRKENLWAAQAAAEAASEDMTGSVAETTSYVEQAAIELAPLLQPPLRKGLVEKVGAAARASILRDIFGNPFRPVAVDPEWLACGRGAVHWHADRAYRRRARFGDLDLQLLAELADAGETAGCPDPELIAHCRQVAYHFRGCWAVDLLLAQE